MNTANNTCKSSEPAMPVSTLSVESPRTERLPWVDAAKVVGIWLVACGHFGHLSREIAYFIYAFHMPLFFFLAGYLEKKRGIMSVFRDSVQKLLVPYLLLNLICYVVILSLLLTGLKNQLGYFLGIPNEFSWQECVTKPLTEVLTGIRDISPFSALISIPTWFLIILFFVKITYHLINKWISKCAVIFSIFIFPILLVLAKTANWANYLYPLGCAFLVFPFFALGVLSKEGKWFLCSAVSLKRRLIFSVLGIIGFCLLGFLFRLNLSPPFQIDAFRRPNMHSCDYGENIIFFYLFGFLGIASVLMLCQIYTAKFKIVEIISGGTILIFAFESQICMPILLKISEKIIGLDVYNLFVCAGLAIVALLLFVIPIRLASKYFPILLGGRRG
jgi:fucose 4-O-acetylase-like acetyltransferase